MESIATPVFGTGPANPFVGAHRFLPASVCFPRVNAESLDLPVRNALREAAGRVAPAAPAGAWLLSGCVATGVAGLLAARGRAGPSAVALAVGATLLLVAVSRPGRAPFAAYLTALVDQVGDGIVLAPLAWPLAHGSVQEGAPAVAALGLLFVGAYAGVRARALGFRVPAAPVGAPERAAILTVGLLAPGTFLEPALWILAALGAAAATRVTVVVWRAKGS